MCGICGFNWKDEHLVKNMTNTLTHRGPDQNGVYCDDKVSLGHRRLSIIDLSENGIQPMHNEDKTIWIVYNGEIYNFPEIREDLIKKGHTFISRTDTEMIIHAYEEYGLECIHKFNGMFSFCIWDQKKDLLFLARDRIGIKPLYYYHKANTFMFASEIKAMLKNPGLEKSLNYQALYFYLGYEFIPAPLTMFENIYKVLPGHYLIVRDGKVESACYWDLRFETNTWARKDAEAREIELIDTAVMRRLISDVPLGVFLSGGLDSSTIVAMMRRHITGTLRTFSIGYRDKSFSELDYAQQVSDFFETKHTVLMIDEITHEDIERASWHLDEPMTDLSTIPLCMICKKAKMDVTVCLSGEGGDESFAGYDRFKASKINRFYRMVPLPLRKHLITPLVAKLPDQPQKKGFINMLKRFIEGSNLPDEGGHMRWQYFSNPFLDDHMYNDNIKGQINFDPFLPIRSYNDRNSFRSILDREIYVDIRFTMPDSVLMKVDKMSMANSLEIRVPFLDHEFVEFNASLPDSWKLKGFRTKDILRSSLHGILPENIVNRGKQGYSFPVKNWLRNELKDYMIDLLNTSPVICENLNVPFINRLIDEHLKMTHNHNHTLWALINVAVWHRNFFEEKL